MLLDLPAEAIIPELAASTRDEVLVELSTNVVTRHPELVGVDIVRILREREQLGSTGIGDGVAIPHGKVRNLGRDALLVFGRSIQGVDFNSLDARKAHLFFLILAADTAVDTHLRMLARISRILKDPPVRKALLEAKDAGSIHAIIAEQERRF
jgi:PTS system nitrogen regulatory IIA component